MLEVRPDGIPDDLKSIAQWVTWRQEWDGDRWTKPLYQVNGSKASTKSRRTWATFDEAFAEYQRSDADGVGFVFTKDDDYVGIDLDHIDTPELTKWAYGIVRKLDSYLEKSPSGTGYHVIARGTLPGPGRKRGRVEAYDRGRYFTVTGHRAQQLPATPEPRQAEIEDLYAKYFADESAPTPVQASTATAHAPAISDDDAIARVKATDNGRALWDGDPALWAKDTGAYPSKSEADLALCREIEKVVGHDAAAIDRLWLVSGLGVRGKVKDRADYRKRTIDLILATPSAPSRNDRFTDLSNAERLVRLHDEDVLRYVHGLSRWHIWDGTRWAIDEDGGVERRAHLTARAIHNEAAVAPTQAQSDALGKWAMRSQSQPRLKAMIDVARALDGTSTKASALDTDLWALNCLNGTIDLRTGVLREHRREDLITKMAPVEFDPAARLDLWDQFLETALPNAETRRYVQKLAGYSLCGEREEDLVVFIHGPPATGKSTWREALTATLGSYAAVASFATFTQSQARGGAPRSDLVALQGARLVTVPEADSSRRLATGMIKQMSGGEAMKERGLYASEIEFRPQFLPVLIGNERPPVPSGEQGIWRRLKEVPFNVTMNPPDRSIRPKLRNPAVAGPAILAWAVEGCLLWQQEGLEAPEEVRDASGMYKLAMDTFIPFIDSECKQEEGATVRAAQLHKAYVAWCSDHDVSQADVLGIRKFGEAIKERVPNHIERDRHGVYYTGFRLLNDAERTAVGTESV